VSKCVYCFCNFHCIFYMCFYFAAFWRNNKRLPVAKVGDARRQKHPFSHITSFLLSLHSICRLPSLSVLLPFAPFLAQPAAWTALRVLLIIMSPSLQFLRKKWLKPGFHYPSWRPELTARIDGWPVSITRQLGPLTRAVNSGSGNRA